MGVCDLASAKGLHFGAFILYCMYACYTPGSAIELEPRLKSDGTPFAPRKLNSYAQFLKDNYNTVKTSSPYRTHAQILEKVKHLYHQSKGEASGQKTFEDQSLLA